MAKKKPDPHRAKTIAKGLPEFYVKFKADTGKRMRHLALYWTIMTMVRTQETRFAEFEKFEDKDCESPMWRLTPEQMKMRNEHLVPLPRQAVELNREIRDLNDYRAAGNRPLGRYPFPFHDQVA